MAKKNSATKEDILPKEGEEPKPRKGELPGMVGDGVSTPQIQALDDAITEYVEYRDKRIAAGIEEKTKKKLVLALMENHKLSSYEVDDLVVIKKPKDDTASIKVMAKADYVGQQAPGPED